MKDWVPAHILKDYNMFCTQAFLIRTWTEEEKIQIQNGCRFTAQFPYQYSKMPMFLEMELMFNDLSNQNQQVAQFKCIALAKFRVNEICQGVFEYIPVIFSDEHFHLVNMCLYCTITEFKFQIPKSSQQQKEDPIMSMGSQILSSKLNLKQQIKQLKELYNTFIQPLRIAYQALSDFYAQLDMEIAYQEKRNSTGGGFQVQKSFSQLPVSCYKDLDRQIELSVDKRRSPNNSGSLDSDEQHILHQSKTIAIEYQQVQSMLQQLWQKVQQLIKQKNYHFLRILKVQSITHQQQRYNNNEIKRYLKFISKEIINLVDHTHSVVPNTLKIEFDQQECKIKRKQTVDQILGPSKVLDLKLDKELRDEIVLLEKHFITNKQNQDNTVTPRTKGSLHLIIFVHGYQGHPFDMRLIENYLCLRHPQHMFMISISNQNCTEGDIIQMGGKLAEEVHDFITQWCPEKQLSRLSFVAHSLGGLIVRAALPSLSQYQDKMYTILTLGSPHLGYLHNKHGLIKFGIFQNFIFYRIVDASSIQKKFVSSTIINEGFRQLGQFGSNEIIFNDSIIFNPNEKGMNWFKNIILFGSTQDHYVTSESSLILKVDDQSNDIHNQIAHNVLKNFNQHQIIRVSVDFNFENGLKQFNIHSDLDTFLGRKAHIAILESHFLLQYIVYNLGDYFR